MQQSTRPIISRLGATALSFAITLVATALVALAILAGCGGGGGGGGTVGPSNASAESTQIGSQLNAFLAAWRPGNASAWHGYLSRRLAAVTGQGSTLLPFTVYDLGADVTNPNDNTAYTFSLDTNAIVYLSADLAIVPIHLQFADGQRIDVRFHMLKEGGTWQIDDIGVTVSPPGAVGPTTITSAELWPLARGNRWRLVDVPVSGGPNPAVATFQTFAITQDATPNANNLAIWTLDQSELSGPLALDRSAWGIATSTLVFGTPASRRPAVRAAPANTGLLDNPVSASGLTLADVVDAGRQRRWRIANVLGIFQFGADGGFNGGTPWRMTPWLAANGASLSQSLTWADLIGSPVSAHARTRMAGTARVKLAWRDFDAVRLDIGVRLADTRAVVESWFFAPGIGPVAVAHYDAVTGNVTGLRVLLDAVVSGVAQGPTTGVPAFVALRVTNPSPIATPTIDAEVAHTFVASGGAAPYSWTLVTGPSWLSLDATTGNLSGKPAATGTLSFTIDLRDANGMTLRQTLQWHIAGVTATGTGTSSGTGANTGTVTGTGTLSGTGTGTATATGTGTGTAAPPATISVALSSVSPDPTNTSPIVVTIAFTEDVSSFAIASITLYGGSAANLQTVAPNRTFSVDVTPSGQGPVTVGIATATLTGLASGTNATSAWLVRTFDDVAPVLAVTSTALEPTALSPIPVQITVNETVNGLTTADFTIGNGTPGPLVEVIPGSKWTLDITPLLVGAVTLNVATGAIRDAAGNTNVAPPRFVRTFSSNSPTVFLSTTAGDPTNASPIPVTVAFSKNVSALTLAGVTVTNGTAANLQSVTASRSWTFDVVPTAPGTVTVQIPAGIVTDQTANGNLAAAPLTRTFDNVSPNTTLTSTAGNPTAVSPIPVAIVFDKPVSGLQLSHILVGNGTPSNLREVTTGRSWLIDVTPSGVGSVTVDVAAGVAYDVAGNANRAAARLSRTFDSVAPIAQLSSTASEPTNVTPIPVTITFSKDVSTLVQGNITVLGGTVTSFAAGTPSRSWTFNVVPSGPGTITVDLAGGVVQDAGGNGNLPATRLTRHFDNTAPTVSLTTIASNPTNTSPIPVALTFSKDVTAPTLLAIAVGNGTPTNLHETVAGRVWTVDVTPTAVGLVTVDLATGAVHDLLGNPSNAAPRLSRAFDSMSPVVLLTSTASAATNVSPFPVTISFSKDMTGFALANLTVGGGTAGNLQVATANRVWRADITPAGQGVVTVDMAASATTDTSGNGNLAAAQLARVFDNIAPTAALSCSITGLTNSTTATATVSGLDVTAYQYKLDSGTWSAEAAVATPISLSGLSDVVHTLYVIGRDAAGNWQTQAAAATVNWTVDATPPTPPTSIVLSPIGGSTVANSLNSTNTNLTVAATITAGEATGGKAELLVNGNPFVPARTDIVIAAGDTQVTFNFGAANNTQLKTAVPTGGIISVRLTDIATNSIVSTVNPTLSVDYLSPTAVLANLPSSFTTNTSTNITVAGPDVVEYQCKLDGGAYGASTSVSTPIALTGLAFGTHTLRVIGRDTAGNWQTDANATVCSWAAISTPHTFAAHLGGDLPGLWQGGRLLFALPYAVAVDASGNAYVLNAGTSFVDKVDTNGNSLQRWGSGGTMPSGITVDSSSNAWVAATGNSYVQKFDNSGNLLGNFICGSPKGVAVDSSGNILVSGSSNWIYKFDAGFNMIASFGGFGTGDGQFKEPKGIAVDATTGNYYVLDSGNNRIQKFNASNAFLTKWGSLGAGDGQFNFSVVAYGIAVDNAGNVFVADAFNNRVQKFDSSGAFLSKFASPTPAAVAVDGSGNVFAVDYHGTLIKHDSAGAGLWQRGTRGTGDGKFYNQIGVAISGGNVFVVDPSARIQKFDASGNFVSKWGSVGSGDGQFSGACDIAADGSGNLFIVESTGNRVQKFSSAGAFILKWGGTGSGTGQFQAPTGIVVDSLGYVYVSDTANHRIQKFDATGAYVTQWGSTGTGDAQFSGPTGLARDAADQIYVADRGNNRIQVFAADGTFLRKWGSTGTVCGLFNSPSGVAVDSGGDLYVADWGNHRIQRFTSGGAFLSTWGSNGPGEGQFNYPARLAFDAADNLFISDTNNYTIEKYAHP